MMLMSMLADEVPVARCLLEPVPKYDRLSVDGDCAAWERRREGVWPATGVVGVIGGPPSGEGVEIYAGRGGPCIPSYDALG